MNAADWFDDVPVLGAMPPEEAVAKLREIGEPEVADAPQTKSFGIKETIASYFGPHPYQHTSHAFGYLAPAAPGQEALPIQHAAILPPTPR